MPNTTSCEERKLPVGREHIECDECSKPGPPMRCSRCRAAFYCSKTCQRKDWKSWHKHHCLDIGRQREIQGFGKASAEILESTHAAQQAPANTSCYICLTEDMVDPFTLPRCGHTFCFTCLQRWQTLQKDSNCPACRKDTPDIVDSACTKASLHWCRAKEKDLDKDEQIKHYKLALAELEQIKPTDIKYIHQVVRTMFQRAQVLLDLENPEKALEVCEEMERNLREGDAAYLETFELVTRKIKAPFNEAKIIAGIIQEKMECCRHKPLAGRMIFQIFLLMALCKEAMGDYMGAINVYVEKMTKAMVIFDCESEDAKNFDVKKSSEEFRLKMNLCRCLYKVEMYDLAILNGKGAIKLNRAFPGVHKYIALSYRDSGNLEAAIRTMGRAVTYEGPWDKSYREMNLKMYNELKQTAS